MKLLKHLAILILALCCSYLANAQCVAAFTDTVNGNNITVNANPVTGSDYAWYIDGTLAQAANPNTEYEFQNVSAGTHHICLWLYTNNTFLCDTVCGNVLIQGTCDTVRTALSGGSTPICYNTSPGTFAANASGGNGTFTYQWYSNNGIISGATGSTYAPGTLTASGYFYCYANSGNCGSARTSTALVTVDSNLTATISGGSTAVCYDNSPGTLVATANGGTGVYAYAWYINGNATGATASTYSPGNLTASDNIYCAVTSGSCGTANTPEENITVSGNITAQWTDIIGSNDTVGFTSYDTNTVALHIWSFGDNTTGNGITVTHVYSAPGTYHVCFYTSVPGSLCSDSLCNNVTVTACNGLTAYWNSPTPATDTLKALAYDTVSYAQHIWSFGDGTTGSGITGTHVYTSPGTYDVCFYASIPGTLCNDTFCRSVVIPAGSNACGVASFESYILNDSTIRGYSNSTGTNDSSIYVWNIYSLNGGIVHSYNTGHTSYFLSGGLSVGTYRVCLDLYNGLNGTPVLCDSFCTNVTVFSCASLSATWTYTRHSNSDSITFNAPQTIATGDSTYSWTFGDGTTSTASNPVHIYAQSGTYTVCLVVGNPALTCHDTLCQSITATGAPNCGTLTAYWNSPTPTSDTLNATAYDTISLAHHAWNFGDGTSGSGTSATHVYSTPGTYDVCFYANIPGTFCSDSLCRNVVIPGGSNCGTAAFSDYIYGDTSIHAYSTSTGTGNTTNYRWTIKGANGNIIQTQSGATNYITSQHLSPGAYIVCLTLYNGNTLCDSVCNTVVVPLVGSCGTASFSDSVIASIGGGSVHAYAASNSSVDSVAQISWKIWGPTGNLVQYFSGVASFSSATLDTGTYVVCEYVRATDETIICDSLCQSVTVGSTNLCSGLTAAWTHTLQSNTTDSVEFHSSANPAGTSYLWTFGDGSYSTASNITHGYAQAGTYTVCLIVSLPNTTCRDTSCQSVVISTTTPCPVAAFSQYIYNDSIIHAYSSSTGTTANTIYQWNVTNSAGVVVETSTSTGTTASLFTNALPNGTYNVCLYVSASPNTLCSYVCHTITIADTINPCSGLNANFTITHLSNGNVQFIPADTATGVTHYWHFGDGTVSTSTDPTHAYPTPGLYHVCQYVYYTGITSCVDSFCINVQAGASGCNANFSAQGYYPPYNGVHFSSLSTSNDSIISYLWAFGDNTTGTFASGNHIFPHSGNWYVCLTIATANGCSSTYCDSVTVSYDACAGLSASYTYTYTQSGGVHFVGSTAITNTTNLWTFGDGTTATTFDPVHYYTQPGTYTVCHIVSIPGTLCSDTTCQSIQGTGVGTGCQANFTDSTSSNTNHIIFYNHSTSTDSIVSYVWTFGDGSGSSNANADHTYSTSGSYYVCLTITSENGCTNTYCDSVHVGVVVSTACHAAFTYTVDSCQVITFTSTSTGSLDFLRWIYGDGTTDTLSHPTHVYAQGGYYTVILHFYGNNCYNFDTAVIYVPICSTAGDTVCGLVFNDLNGNGVQNTGEPGIANAEVHVGNYVTHTDSTGHYVIVVPAGTYTIYYCTTSGYTFSIPVNAPYNTISTCAAYQTVTVGNGANCGYNFGILSNSATICGTVYFDANDNHAQDQNESGIANAKVVFTSGGLVVYTVYTDQYGHYCAVLPSGTYVITASSSTYPNGVVYPVSITVTASAGGAYDNNNFGIYVEPGACDLSISISPNTTITPGYVAWYQIQVCNVGPVVTSGTVNLFYDPSLTYNYSSPAPTSQNSSTFTASWDLDNLNPGSCQYYYVSLTTDSSAVPGQFVFTLANVTTNGCTDANLNNNVDTVHQNVTSSWDPNNKQVSPLGVGAEGGISGDQWLTYTINFQNTGTAPAVNIVVQDTLSANLDVSTFKMLGASLPYTMQFAGREAIWKFNSVMLPDSSTDQQGSHGFVSFMILPVQGLPGKTQITNSADIFFDYNAGVNTNQTLNTIDYTLSVAQIAADNVTITLQPNPFAQYTTIKIAGAQGPYQLNVYDMLGRQVKSQPATGNTFDVDRGSLAAGMYMYEIVEQGKVIGKGKMIAQ